MTTTDIAFIKQHGLKIGSTEVKGAIKGKHVLAEALDRQLPSTPQVIPTDDMRVGSAIHALAAHELPEYETDEYIRATGGRSPLAKGARRKEGEELLWKQAMIDRVKDSIIVLEESQMLPADYTEFAEKEYVEDGGKLKDLFWYLRAKPDYYNPNTGELIDLKTTKQANCTTSISALFTAQHHIQIGLYTRILRSQGLPVNKASIVTTPSDALSTDPYPGVFKRSFTDRCLEYCIDEANKGLAEVEEYIMGGLQLKMEDFIITVDLPYGARMQMNANQ